MIEKVFTTVEEAMANNPGPLSRKVLEYSLVYKRVTDQAKGRTITAADWAPLAELVAVDDFERIGVWKEVMRWPEYAQFMADFANSSTWEGSFKRVTETPGLVILELEERTREHGGEPRIPSNTVTVYEFDGAGKIRHLDVYYQHAN